MHGELVLGLKEMRFMSFNDMKAIYLGHKGGKTKIIVSPISYFLTKPCFDIPDHMLNFKEEDFRSKQLEAVQ